MIVLALSTSCPRGTVAIAREGQVVARIAYDGGTSHAERLFAAIDQAMAEAGVRRPELSAVACDVGPGSFTGVRVGVASAKGIALALALPVVGIGALESMAHAAAALAGGREVLVAVDARKGEVFAAMYDAKLALTWGATHLGRDETPGLVARVAAVDALVVGEIFTELVGLGAPPRGADLDLPDAASIARLASVRLGALSATDAQERYDAALLEAVYVRAPDARPMAQP